MITQENISLVIQLATLGGIVFGVYSYFKKPQDKLEKSDAVQDVKFQALEKTVVNLRDNHIHTLSEKLDKHIMDNQIANVENVRQLTRIETLLDIRLPK